MFKKGNIPWNKGKKRPPFSKKWRNNMRLGHLGKSSGMLGKKHKPETIARIKKWKPNKKQLAKMSRKKDKHRLWLGDDVIVKCAICKKEISCRPNKIRKYCSYKCLGKSKRKIKNRCIDCGKILPRKETSRCRICNAKIYSGENNHFWKGGISPYNALLRHSGKFKQWRNKVFLRDNYTCQSCGQKGNKLHPHHIKEFAKYPKLRFVVSNGITLCEDCHREIHKIKNYKNANNPS